MTIRLLTTLTSITLAIYATIDVWQVPTHCTALVGILAWSVVWFTLWWLLVETKGNDMRCPDCGGMQYERDGVRWCVRCCTRKAIEPETPDETVDRYREALAKIAKTGTGYCARVANDALTCPVP